MWVCVCVWLCTCESRCLRRQEEGVRFLPPNNKLGLEAVSHPVWVLGAGIQFCYPGEQEGLGTPEPSLQPQCKQINLSHHHIRWATPSCSDLGGRGRCLEESVIWVADLCPDWHYHLLWHCLWIAFLLYMLNFVSKNVWTLILTLSVSLYLSNIYHLQHSQRRWLSLRL